MKISKIAFLTTIFLGIFFINSAFAGIFSFRDDTNSIDNKLNPNVYALALKAYHAALDHGVETSKQILTIIDYSLPSNAERLWVVDVAHNKILMSSLVAHGKNSGEITPNRFSDEPGTLTSSIGLYLTGGTYEGKHGNSLKLQGLEKGFNSKAEARGIVIHPASYVSEDIAKTYHRIGRSWGCPAVPEKIARPLINTIKNHTLVFAYYPNRHWLQSSAFLR